MQKQRQNQSVSMNHNVWENGRMEAESNRRLSVYQPSALIPPGQIGWITTPKKAEPGLRNEAGTGAKAAQNTPVWMNYYNTLASVSLWWHARLKIHDLSRISFHCELDLFPGESFPFTVSWICFMVSHFLSLWGGSVSWCVISFHCELDPFPGESFPFTVSWICFLVSHFLSL